jgi:hypothetical protein
MSTEGRISYAGVCREAAAKAENVADQLLAIDEPGTAREYLQSAAALRSLAALIELAGVLKPAPAVGVLRAYVDDFAASDEYDNQEGAVADWMDTATSILAALRAGFAPAVSDPSLPGPGGR